MGRELRHTMFLYCDKSINCTANCSKPATQRLLLLWRPSTSALVLNCKPDQLIVSNTPTPAPVQRLAELFTGTRQTGNALYLTQLNPEAHCTPAARQFIRLPAHIVPGDKDVITQIAGGVHHTGDRQLTTCSIVKRNQLGQSLFHPNCRKDLAIYSNTP